MEQEIYDGTCPSCAGDNIKTVKNTVVGGKIRSQEKRCVECGIPFTVSERRLKVAEYEPNGGK